MTFDKKVDELVRTILRPVRGCATDSQYSDAYDRAVTALTTIHKEEREAAFKEARRRVYMISGSASVDPAVRKGFAAGINAAIEVIAALEAAATKGGNDADIS